MTIQSLAPVIAFAGTLIVALLGFYEWKKQYSNANRAVVAAAQREAYAELWEKLEEINLDLRKQRANNPCLYERLREINRFFLAHSLYFDDRDQVLINDYIAAMHVVREKIYASGSDEAVSAFQMTMRPSFPVLEKEIRESFDRADELRNKLKKKVQQVAGTP